MSLTVQVTWLNPESSLLPDDGANIVLQADGQTLRGTTPKKGARQFKVPDGATTLTLTATFTASFGPVGGPAPNGGAINVGPLSGVVLSVTQAFDIVGQTQLRPQPIPQYGGPHPLVLTRGLAGRHGAALIVISTDFVDVSPFWSQYCANWSYYLGAHQPGCKTFVLGHTGGMPVIWLATVADACVSAQIPSCLVFYRPASYAYSRLNQPHQGSAIARYLLIPKPDSDATAQYWERDHVRPATASEPEYNLMRCRFEDSVTQARRALVMLHPWPSGSDFGIATQSTLPAHCERAIRFLWAQQLLGAGVAGVRLGRLGLSGFSRGGLGLWAALAASKSRIREVFAFDCNGTDANVEPIVQWFQSNDSNMLRLVSGEHSFGAHAAIHKRIAPSLSPRPDLTITPRDRSEYESGQNSVWDHYISITPGLRHDTTGMGPDTRHQFAICGGQLFGDKTAPYDFDLVEAYLLQFLRASGFARG